MKRTTVFAAVMAYILAFVLSGCTPQLFETDGYRQMNAVYTSVLGGEALAKNEIFNKLGYPESYTTAEGETFKLHAGDRAALWDTLLQSSVTEWGYSCRKYSDSDYEYELRLIFNSENVTSGATFG